MKKQIRRAIFESNSSTTHTLVICSEKEFNDWTNGKTLLNGYRNKFIENREMNDEEKEEAVKDYYDRFQRTHKYTKKYEELTSEEKAELYKEAQDNGYFEVDEDYKSYKQWNDDEYLETFEYHYTTEHGDKIVAFGKYGNDY